MDMMRFLNVSCTCGVHDSGKFFFFSIPHCTSPALSSFPRPSVLIRSSAVRLSSGVLASLSSAMGATKPSGPLSPSSPFLAAWPSELTMVPSAPLL